MRNAKCFVWLMFYQEKTSRLFADDTILFISGVKFIMLSNNCNYCIDGSNEWFTVNDM